MLKRGRMLAPLIAGLTLASPAVAAPAMWEVRDADSSIWLFGSIHILPPEANWRTELFDQVMAKADQVVFEADVGPAAMADIGAKSFATGIYTDGTLLTDVIDAAAETKLRALLDAVHIPMGTVLAMKPWMAMNTVSVAAMASSGLTAQGVEYVLQPELPVERQRYLETGDEQLAVLSGGTTEEQIEMLEYTLDEADRIPKITDKMVSSWLQGKTERMAELFLDDMGGTQSAFMDRLIYARNKNWIPSLEGMLKDNTQALVVVGAAHLTGEGSVLDLLEQAGYTVEQIQ